MLQGYGETLLVASQLAATYCKLEYEVPIYEYKYLSKLWLSTS